MIYLLLNIFIFRLYFTYKLWFTFFIHLYSAFSSCLSLKHSLKQSQRLFSLVTFNYLCWFQPGECCSWEVLSWMRLREAVASVRLTNAMGAWGTEEAQMKVEKQHWTQWLWMGKKTTWRKEWSLWFLAHFNEGLLQRSCWFRADYGTSYMLTCATRKNAYLIGGRVAKHVSYWIFTCSAVIKL